MTKSIMPSPDLAPSRFKMGGGWILSSILLASLALIALAGAGRFRFGSMGAAIGFLSGDRILVDSPTKSFGSLPSGEVRDVSFLITNMTGRPLGVAGSTTSCPCAVATGLPATIPIGGQKRIDIRVARSARAGPFDQDITLFLDDPGTRTLSVHVTGFVTSPAKVEAFTGEKEGRP